MLEAASKDPSGGTSTVHLLALHVSRRPAIATPPPPVANPRGQTRGHSSAPPPAASVFCVGREKSRCPPGEGLTRRPASRDRRNPPPDSFNEGRRRRDGDLGDLPSAGRKRPGGGLCPSFLVAASSSLREVRTAALQGFGGRSPSGREAGVRAGNEPTGQSALGLCWQKAADAPRLAFRQPNDPPGCPHAGCHARWPPRGKGVLFFGPSVPPPGGFAPPSAWALLERRRSKEGRGFCARSAQRRPGLLP